MPTFENVEVDVSGKVDVDFEVWCGTCGDGLCMESTTQRSPRRGYLQVTVNACPKCMKAKDTEIDELQGRIAELEKKIEELEN